MKPTHYHTTFTFSAVTLHEHKGDIFTSDGYKASSIDLRPIEELLGRRVCKNGLYGKIVDILTDERRFLDGKYREHSKRYSLNISFINAQVGVSWETPIPIKNPMPYYWNNFSTLTLI